MAALIVILCAVVTGVHGWGAAGHQATAAIAANLLTTAAKANASKILNGASLEFVIEFFPLMSQVCCHVGRRHQARKSVGMDGSAALH